MKENFTVVCIADTHTLHNEIALPEGDIIVHAGDATYRGTIKEVEDFARWYGKTPYRHHIFVAGNHDFLFENSTHLAKTIMQDNGITYLQDEAVVVYDPEVAKTITVYGCPHTPWFHDWAFNRYEDQLEDIYGMIPEGVDILVTHGPALGVLDEVCQDFKQKWLGSQALIDQIQRVKPRFHVCGHIHEGYGQTTRGETRFVNAAVCDRNYRPTNAPIVIEV